MMDRPRLFWRDEGRQYGRWGGTGGCSRCVCREAEDGGAGAEAAAEVPVPRRRVEAEDLVSCKNYEERLPQRFGLY